MHSVLTSHDVLVVLDQDEAVVRSILAKIMNQPIKCIFNQHISSFTRYVNRQNMIFINSEESNDVEESVIAKIDGWHLDSARLQPIAHDARSKVMLEMARKAAKTSATVLISGETGTGKEVLAKYIHQHSSFHDGPYITVNCAALPENMMEAILFGYEKGAFTSAVNTYVGKFEQAQNGTLLLDEIAEMPIGLQAKLLRVLQERELERLSGKRVVRLNLRVIAASNRDLKNQVINGLFRKDLYYRLHVLSVRCPALRERLNDILPLAEYFIRHHAKILDKNEPVLTEGAKNKLVSHVWPGNIRELENVIQRAMIMTEGAVIDAGDISLEEGLYDFEQTDGQGGYASNIEQFSSKLEESEAKAIMEVLHEADGCRNIAARRLNISPRTLRYKIAKLRAIGLKVP
ncbi:sigma-54 interaction domain-containing protein [Aquicella siphonis]|nr:sigma-54 dependent transcriptional regulator [Aquicella siphonis]